MKAVLVESYNGYMAKGPNDDMSWTPSIDKQLFKLITLVCGGVCICSRHTYALLPAKMKEDPNRTYIIADREGVNSLENLNERFPDAVLIGGPRFLKAAQAAGVIDRYIITTVMKHLLDDIPTEYKNPFEDLMRIRPPRGVVRFQDITVRVY